MVKSTQRIFRIALIWAFAAACCAAVAPLVIYDDATSWKLTGDADLHQTNTVRSGSKAIYIRGSSLILTSSNPVSCSGYDKLEFWAHGGSAEHGALRFDVIVDGIWPTAIRQQRFLWIAAGQWEKYSVPLSYLGNPATITEISFKPDNKGAGSSIYIDDLQLATGPHDSYMPLPAYPEMIIDGGFEHGANGQYTMGCKSELVTNPVHRGKYALRVFDRPSAAVRDTDKAGSSEKGGKKNVSWAWTGPNFELTRYIMMGGPGLYQMEVWYRAAQGTIKVNPAIEAIYWDPSDSKHGKGPVKEKDSKPATKEVGTEWTQVTFTVNFQFGKLFACLKFNPVAEEGKEYFIDDVSVRKLPEEAAEKNNPTHTIDGMIRHVPVTGSVLTDIASRYSVAVLGTRGSKPGAFAFPAGISLDKHGNLWVADTDNHRLQKLDRAGQWSVVGVGGELRYPRSVAVDKDGAVFAGDSGHFRIVKRVDGKWKDVIKSAGTKPEVWNETAKRGLNALHPVKFDHIWIGSLGLMVLDPWYGMLCAVKPDGSTVASQ